MSGQTRRSVLKGALAGSVAAAATGDPAHAAKRPRGRRPKQADVCVVGAGIAGLTTARRLVQAGVRSVVVLEANDRVGGRTVNLDLGGGKVTEGGGQWVGPLQTRVLALTQELGLETFKTYVEGSTVLLLHGQRQTYSGVIPPFSPTALADFTQAQTRLDDLARQTPLDKPWTRADAATYDAMTLGQWLDANMVDADAKYVFLFLFSISCGTDPHNMSMLFALFFITSSGGIDQLVNTAGGSQDSRIVGGSQQLSLRMAADLGRRVVLGSPVTAIDQSSPGGVTVRSARRDVRCRRVVLAMTPRDAERIVVTPPLPIQRTILQKNWQTGTGWKTFCVYDKPFWREDGLNGQALSDLPAALYTADNSPPDGSPGVLLSFLGTANASVLFGLTPEQLASRDARRDAVVAAMTQLFGPKAAKPVAYLEKDWSREPYISGCESPRPPGLITQYTSADVDPVGRIHYAGTETAEVSEAYMDGAVRSGERVSAELLKVL